MAVLHSDYVHGRNDLILERIVVHEKRKFRTHVRRNAYDFQSAAVTYVWAGDRWESVAVLHGEDPRMAALPTYGTRDDANAAAALAEVAELLEARAYQVVFNR